MSIPFPALSQPGLESGLRSPPTYVVMFSGGVCSWAAAKCIVAEHGAAGVVLLFADTNTEHPDTYRFLREAAADVGAPLVTVADGRDIWQVFKDKRFLGNSRIDPCSQTLKRIPLNRWVQQNCDPEKTTLVFGIHWEEAQRFERTAKRLAPWKCRAPMTEDAYWMTNDEMHQWAKRSGLRRQFLYEIGMPHANCGGCCVKAGKGAFLKAYERNREVFDQWERKEAELQQFLGRPVTILKEVRQGVQHKLSLREFRERIEANQCSEDDFDGPSGCGCALPGFGEADDNPHSSGFALFED